MLTSFIINTLMWVISLQVHQERVRCTCQQDHPNWQNSDGVFPNGSVFPDHGPDPDHFQNKGLIWSDFSPKSPEKSVFTYSNIRCASAKNSKNECQKTAKILCEAKNNVVFKFLKTGLFFPLKWSVFGLFLGKKLVCFWSVFSL